MNDSGRKELILYLRVFDVILFIMFVVFGIVGIITLAVVGIPGIMFIIPACLAFSYWLGKYRAADTLIKEIEDNGKMRELTEDFHNGERFFNGRVICGRTYLMSRGAGLILQTENIIKIYPYNRKNGFAGDTRMLRAEMADGKKHDLTFLSMKGKNEEDVKRLISTIEHFHEREEKHEI